MKWHPFGSKWLPYCAAAMFVVAGPVLAQNQTQNQNQNQQSMPGMQMGGAPAANEAPSSRAFRDAMTKMDQGMNVPYTGNADRDFVAGMIPHHQGAVDMAKVELQYGKDPALKKLARDIVAAQQREIAFMQQWQVKHAK